MLIVTLWAATWRETPPTKPVSPARAPLDSDRMAIGDFTAPLVMLTIRPKPRAIMPSITAWMRKTAASMLPSMALIQSSRVKLRKSPPAGVVDEDVRGRLGGQQGFAAVIGGDVAGDGDDRRAGLGYDLPGGAVQPLLAAGGQRQDHALAGQ